MALVLTGRVVTFDDDRPVINDGAVYVHNGMIDAVQRRTTKAPSGFEKAERVATGGTIYPGLVDLHNHLAYNFLPLWRAPKTEPYTSRHQWPGAATYGREVSQPAEAMKEAAAAATLRYAEVRAVVGGVTSIQGSPQLKKEFVGWMVRNIEKQTFPDLDNPVIFQAVIQADTQTLTAVGEKLGTTKSFIYHLAEGTDPKLNGEYRDLRKAKCVHERLIAIHATALGATEYGQWATKPGTIVWSPFSNLWLYGDTTDVVEARRQGILVCLGSDWGPSGTRNLLGELKVAALWNEKHLDKAFTPHELCEMATANPGDALARSWGRQVGRLRPGALADLMVTATRQGDAYRNLLNASERHVRLVVSQGHPVYGNRALMKAAGATNLESIRVAGTERTISMRLPADQQPDDPMASAEVNMSWKDGLAAMQRVVDNPALAVKQARGRKPKGGFRPVTYELDMPGPDGGAARALTDDELANLVMLPIEPLGHDAAWFRQIRNGHPHGAILAGLGAYFR
ncbi:MAG: amidohydrolase family protein [Acidimicrobiia bacterium]|nr:amidohydrolase family protein [Acidimicrobiia bacterium]